MVDGRGGVRPHWRGVLGSLFSMDAGRLADRARRLEQVGEAEGSAPSWRCDPVPLPIPAPEFAALEDGLCQRARLLESILADLYGPQSMLADGVLPPALVFANPAFLRACRANPAAPAAPFLQNYAADLVRGPDGIWRVLADRTNGALGIGYARESRRLLARVVPELFRTSQVRQLRPFFEAWQDAVLRTVARPDGSPPVVALLTPGAQNPHWPEHLALSRDLACALVEAQDLTVQSGQLYLMTLNGQQQVDVLLRRVPGHGLDGLAHPGAAGGITGLLEAARHGAVHILNHPGAGAIEAPGLAAFMPALCRRLLGERLRLATVPTMWLADDGAQRTMAQGFGRWFVRPALDPAPPPQALGELSHADRARLERAIAAAPWQYTACTAVTPSVAPCHGPDGLLALPVVLRLYLMHDGQGWRAMQGGLARVLRPGEHVTEALPTGAVFKDVWVLTDESRDIRGPDPAVPAQGAVHRVAAGLPSRVAEDFFWLGRHVERLDAFARLGRAGLLRRARGAPLPRETVELHVLGRCLYAARLAEAEHGTALDDAIRASLHDGGAATALNEAARLTEALRDRIAVETHTLLRQAIRGARTGLQSGIDGLVDAMTGLRLVATIVAGVMADGMVLGGGRLFLEAGRRVERARITVTTLATVLDQPACRMDSALRLVLELCDSTITYRSRYLSVMQPGPVLDLVLADTGNPRALATQFAELAALLAAAGDAALAEAAARLGAQTAALAAQAAGDIPLPDALPDALFGIGASTARLLDQMHLRFFAPLPAAQAVGLALA